MRWMLLLGLLLLGGCQARVLASDDFTQTTGRWLLEQDNFGRSVIANGQLFIDINQPNTMQYATLQQQTLTDLHIQVDGTLLDGSLHSSYGVLIRKQPGGAFYRFAVTGSGAYNVERHDAAGIWQPLTDARRWEESVAVRAGLGQTNRLEVIARDNIVIFQVNDQVVFRSDNFDGAYLNGTLGLSAGTFAQGGTRVAFDNLIVTEPE